jgi:hypothetical protein
VASYILCVQRDKRLSDKSVRANFVATFLVRVGQVQRVGKLEKASDGLEHIGATDRGVMMFRNQTRRGIRAVQAGHDPAGLCRDAGVAIPTYCNDTVMRMPSNADPEMDRQRMRDTGRRLADGYLRDPPLLASM